MNALAARALLTLCAALACIGGGYWWGHGASDNAWEAKQAKTDKKVREKLAALGESASRASLRYLDQHLAQKAQYADLDAKYRDLRRRAPLVVPRPVVVASCPKPPAPQPQPAPDPAGDSSPVLTLAAVRLWNGALAGVDSPAGACGLAGAAEGADLACADSAGLTLDDAWANHAVNAQSCAEDRQRYQQLINFLKE